MAVKRAPKTSKDVLRVIPLGGIGEIGKNMTVFEFGGDREGDSAWRGRWQVQARSPDFRIGSAERFYVVTFAEFFHDRQGWGLWFHGVYFFLFINPYCHGIKINDSCT